MRYFTLDEANQALVLVRPIVDDIMVKRRKLIRLEQQLRVMRKLKSSRDVTRLQKVEYDFRNLIESLEHHMGEIAQIGCMLKDTNRGLIDFPSWHHGREVNLCWVATDTEVQYWHEIAEGYTSRHPIDETFRPQTHTPELSIPAWH